MIDLYGVKFQEARIRVLERDNHRCRTCDHDGTIWRLEVHHRHYRDGANPKDEDLITLCVACHDLITNRMRDLRYIKKALTEVVEDSKIDFIDRPKFTQLSRDMEFEDSTITVVKPIFTKRNLNV